MKKSNVRKNRKISAAALVAKSESAAKLAQAAKKHLKLIKSEHKQARKAFKQAKKAARRARKEAEAALEKAGGKQNLLKAKPAQIRAVKKYKSPRAKAVVSTGTITALPLAASASVANGGRSSV